MVGRKLILVSLLLTGCVETFVYVAYRSDIGYEGDSLCGRVFDTEQDDYKRNQDDRKVAPALAGFVFNCVIGRRIVDIDKAIQRKDGKPWRIFFLALGSNDVMKETDLNTFTNHYQMILDSVNAERVICVLPKPGELLGRDTEQYRYVIKTLCTETLDLWDYGVRYRAKDGVHMNDFDNDLAYIKLNEMAKE